MKYIMDMRGNILLAAAAVLAGVVLGVALYGKWQVAEAVLGGSGNVTFINNPHNFSKDSKTTSVKATLEDRICIFCHTPHNASMDSSLIDGPLWNHELSTASYTTWAPQLTNSPPYIVNVGFVNVLTTQPSQLDGSSRMCMGCHDGTIGIGNVVSGADIAMDTTHTCIAADGSLDESQPLCDNIRFTDLTTKHIVSIPMNQQLIENSVAACDGSQTTMLSFPWDGDSPRADTVFLRPTATAYNDGSSDTYGVSSGFPNAKYKTGYNYGVQCSTCHDPHKWDASSGKEGYKFLVTANVSDLCITCHDQCS